VFYKWSPKKLKRMHATEERKRKELKRCSEEVAMVLQISNEEDDK